MWTNLNEDFWEHNVDATIRKGLLLAKTKKNLSDLKLIGGNI